MRWLSFAVLSLSLPFSACDCGEVPRDDDGGTDGACIIDTDCVTGESCIGRLADYV